MKAEIYHLGGDSSNFYGSHCFQDCLLKNYNELKDIKKSCYNKYANFLTEYFEKDVSGMSKEDRFYNLFFDELFIDYDFAKTLNRLDSIGASVFKTKTEVGQALIKLIEYSEIFLVVDNKIFISKNEIEINVESAHKEKITKCILNIQKGKFA